MIRRLHSAELKHHLTNPQELKKNKAIKPERKAQTQTHPPNLAQLNHQTKLKQNWKTWKTNTNTL